MYEWRLKWGGRKERSSLEKAAKAGIESAKARLASEPQVEGRYVDYWKAYADLHRERTYSEFAPQAISSTTIKSYLEIMGVAQELQPDYYTIIGVLDSVFIEHSYKTSKRHRGK